MATPTISDDGVVRINVRVEHRAGLDELGHLVALVLTTHRVDGLETVAKRSARWWRGEVADVLHTFGQQSELQDADGDVEEETRLIENIVGRVWPELNSGVG